MVIDIPEYKNIEELNKEGATIATIDIWKNEIRHSYKNLKIKEYKMRATIAESLA